MLVDVFFKTGNEEISKTQYLGRLEINDSVLKGLTEDKKNSIIKGVIVNSMSNNIDWTPVSEDGKNIGYEKIDDSKLN